MVGVDGAPLGPVSIEHIVPKTHGGDNKLINLALACSRFYIAKGARLDRLPLENDRLQRIILLLQARRRERWRDREEAPDSKVPGR